jgi:hypothetical protein
LQDLSNKNFQQSEGRLILCWEQVEDNQEAVAQVQILWVILEANLVSKKIIPPVSGISFGWYIGFLVFRPKYFE